MKNKNVTVRSTAEKIAQITDQIEMIKLTPDIKKYLILLLIASYVVQIIVIIQGGEDSALFTPLIGLMMFFPAIGALIVLLRSGEGLRYIDWRIGKPIYVIIGLTLPAIVTLLAVVAFEELGLGANQYFTRQGVQITIQKELFLLGNSSQNIAFFVLNFIITGIAYSVITGLVTVGEEVGWRGYLQKKLLEYNSVFKSLFFVGLVWGIWHFPLILSGYNYPEYPILGAFVLFPLTTIFSSFLLGWLTISGKSIWPAVLTHGGVNSIMAVLLTMEFGENKLLGNCSIVGIWLIIGLIAFFLVRKKDHTERVS